MSETNDRLERKTNERTAVRKGQGRASSALKKKSAGVRMTPSATGKSARRKRVESDRRTVKKRTVANKWSVLDRILIAAICLLLLIGVVRVVSYANFKARKSVVNSEGFRPQTVVDGRDVSEMSYTDAVNYWETQVEPAYRNAAVTFDDGTSVTAGELGCTSDYATALENAWHSGRTGTLVERYKKLKDDEADQVDHIVTRRAYDDKKVRAYVADIAARLDSQPEDAGIESFDTSTFKFTFHQSRPGAVVNQEKLVSDIEAALENGGGQVSIEIDSIEPSVSTKSLSSEYGLICEARTDASSSTKNRKSNIRLALSMLNGQCVEPGETFSFNKAVGERTKARGFKEAPAYIRGSVQDQVGGGICQVSTTLFNAAIKADMEIKERHPHSMRVSYVDPGKDATVDWDSMDLRFANNSNEKIYIAAYMMTNGTVRIGMFGHKLPNGETITVETKKKKEKAYSTQYQVNFAMAPGTKKVKQQGKKGCEAETIKVRKDANNKEISRETLFKVGYNPTPEIIEYGPE